MRSAMFYQFFWKQFQQFFICIFFNSNVQMVKRFPYPVLDSFVLIMEEKARIGSYIFIAVFLNITINYPLEKIY